MIDSNSILNVLDLCCGQFSFPALDNGYVYLAASRMSLHRSEHDWTLVTEVFGYSPRFGLPDLTIQTFGNRLHNRKCPENFVSLEAYENYLANSPHNEFRSFYPLEEGPWMDENVPESVAKTGSVILRGREIFLPSKQDYADAGIELESDQPAIFEFCRCLAHRHRDVVLATPEERRVNTPPELAEILVIEDWHHPDLVAGEVTSQTETFRQLAEVLRTGDISLYDTAEEPNTHWRNWPEGGSL